MAIKIKKNYKQPDGTFVEIEGTEAEIEAWEHKQEKKRKSENIKKEKTVLYGKDLENLRQIVREEIAAQPYRFYNPYYNPAPFWTVGPYVIPWYGTTTSDNTITTGTITCTPTVGVYTTGQANVSQTSLGSAAHYTGWSSSNNCAMLSSPGDV